MRTPEFQTEIPAGVTFRMRTLATPEGDSTYAYDEGDVNADSLFPYHLEMETKKQREKQVQGMSSEDLFSRMNSSEDKEMYLHELRTRTRRRQLRF